ncbi:sigma-70 family RNA polymerase sigma factor [Ideonella sp. DXS29W]|uniref:Sigma-70 family RNA polymerase sigma factor n=1 Tax=Ideonella lacteola TaxID=2984193 RepID=A0ABU9BM16_9BURK
MATSASSSAQRAEALGALLARVSLGDRAAFATLYEHTAAHLLGVILRINTDRAQAEDLLQEIFVKIWSAAGSFDAQRAQAMTWLTSIARNRAIDSLRRRQTEPQWVTVRPGLEEGEDDDVLDGLASEDAGPMELLGQAVQARAVGVCMRGLTGEQQQTLALAFYQGLSHSEVAEQLRQPLGTVKSWVRRGLIALRSCLERAGAIDPLGA